MIQHPDAFMYLTDRFNKPVSLGQTVVVPSTARKYYNTGGVVRLAEGALKKITPLVYKPGDWISTGPKSRQPLIREDQQGRARPTEYLFPFEDKESLRYAWLAGVDLGGGRLITVVFGTNVLVKP
jgi:hypothetical protein